MKRILPITLLAATTPCQDWRLLDVSIPVAAAYDHARGRLVVFGNRGDTSELRSGELQQRAVPPRQAWHSALCFDSVRATTWLLEVDFAGATFDVLTSRFDGIEWTDVTPVTRPTPRSSFAATFDSARGEIVLFGGTDPYGVLLGETWTFDGTTWTQRSPTTSPSLRQNAALASDAARGRVVLFGGVAGTAFADTWEWDGSSWSQRPTNSQPSPRHSHTMAFDPLRNRTVLFGGKQTWSTFPADDTWEWDGLSWTQINSPVVRPADRYFAAADFDPDRGEIVLVGGLRLGPVLRDAWSFDGTRWQSVPIQAQRPFRPFAGQVVEPGGLSVLSFGGFDYNNIVTADTWRWDGNAWSAIAAPGPSARVRAATCTSPNHSWLFGGDDYGNPGTMFGDLWQWDGAAWTQVASSGPTARTSAGMSFDLQAGEIVLFGGASPQPLGDTWTFDGTSWMQRQPATTPAARFAAAMAYDPILGRTVLCGGSGGGYPLSDTWEWNGTDWTAVPSATVPVFLHASTATFDLQSGRVVLRATDTNSSLATGWSYDGQAWNLLGDQPLGFGTGNGLVDGQLIGFPHPHGVLLADGLNLHASSATAAATTRYGTACGVNAPGLAADSWPRLGNNGFAIEVLRAPPSSLALLLGAVQSAMVPVAGCTQLVLPGQAAILLPTTGIGTASVPLPIPTGAGFLGVDLFFQAAALDASVPAGFVMSDGLRITIGD